MPDLVQLASIVYWREWHYFHDNINTVARDLFLSSTVRFDHTGNMVNMKEEQQRQPYMMNIMMPLSWFFLVIIWWKLISFIHSGSLWILNWCTWQLPCRPVVNCVIPGKVATIYNHQFRPPDTHLNNHWDNTPALLLATRIILLHNIAV